MSRTIIEIAKQDRLYNINFTLNDYNGVAVNLTGVTFLRLKAQLNGSSSLSLTGVMGITNATAGTCYYQVQATDFATAGLYDAEIEVTYANGQIITFQDILIKVAGDLPK